MLINKSGAGLSVVGAGVGALTKWGRGNERGGAETKK